MCTPVDRSIDVFQAGTAITIHPLVLVVATRQPNPITIERESMYIDICAESSPTGTASSPYAVRYVVCGA